MNRASAAFCAATIIFLCLFGCQKKNSDDVNRLTLVPPTTPQAATSEEDSVGADSVPDTLVTNAETSVVTDAVGSTSFVRVVKTTEPVPSTLVFKPMATKDLSITASVTRPSYTAPTRTTILRTTLTAPTYAPTRREPTTRARHTTTAVVRTTQPTTAQPLDIEVPLGETYTYTVTKTITENGKSSEIQVVNKCKLVSAKSEKNELGTATITLGFEVVRNSSYGTFMLVGYDCYDATGKKLNSKTLMCTVANGGAVGKINLAMASAPPSTAKVVFVNYEA